VWPGCGRPGRSFRVGGRSCPSLSAQLCFGPAFIAIHSHLGAPVARSYIYTHTYSRLPAPHCLHCTAPQHTHFSPRTYLSTSAAPAPTCIRNDCNDAGISSVRPLPARLHCRKRALTVTDASGYRPRPPRPRPRPRRGPAPAAPRLYHHHHYPPPHRRTAPGTRLPHVHHAAARRSAHCACRAQLDAHH
jgi:hypothetical protein